MNTTIDEAALEEAWYSGYTPNFKAFLKESAAKKASVHKEQEDFKTEGLPGLLQRLRVSEEVSQDELDSLIDLVHQDDLETWTELYQASGKREGFLKEHYVKARTTRGERERTLRGYLIILGRRLNLSTRDILVKSGWPVDLLRATLHFCQYAPSKAEIDSLIAGLALDQAEARSLHQLRDEAQLRMQAWQEERLAAIGQDWLQMTESSV